MTWRLSASAARRRAAPLRGRGAGRCRGRRGLQGLSLGLPGDGQLGLGEAEPVGQTLGYLHISTHIYTYLQYLC